MKATALVFAILHFAGLAVFAAAPAADQVLAKAKARAAAEQKAIYVHFGAFWCGWCKRLDAFLEQPDIKPVFEKYFIPVKLVVQESDNKKDLENAGAEELLKKWGGPDGLPYSVFLDANGALIVNSKHPTPAGKGGNIGYPAQPGEIDWFLQMIKKAAPKITDDYLKRIETILRAPKK